ncbi:MAG TPA: hypothetical protein DEP53_16365 [Bacteroidetes bacterium]|nr:hypothetical protein [Bacteroidota bacterium]
MDGLDVICGNPAMKLRVHWIGTIALGAVLMVVGGCRTQQEAATVAGSLTGTLFVTGNEPFTDISLQSAHGRMHVIQRDTSELYSRLRGLQGKKVRLQFRLPAARKDSSLIIVNHYDLVTER